MKAGRSGDFWSKVDKTPSCWLWLGARADTGYGHVRRSKDGMVREVLAHRHAYATLRGPIPTGMDIDHLCRVRHCVNPDHLEPVTRRENLLRSPFTRASIRSRQTHCVHGHPFDEENTRWYRGTRTCRACSREQGRARYAAQKAAA